ncbi:MAG: glycosyltransferase family 39 protein, partial [Cyanobacteria bacterium P01_D01_bin.73]
MIALLFRLPYFFQETINWDEGTLILMGQSILDGHLPYTQLWDLKPFFAFLNYSVFVLISGKTIWGIRLAGLFYLSISAFFCYYFAKRIFGQAVAGLSAFFAILIASSIPSGQATMTEIVALPYLCASLFCFSAQPRSRFHICSGAVLLALAANVRSNLAIVAIGLSIYLAVDCFLTTKSVRAVLKEQGLYYASGFGVTAILLIPYLYTGNFNEWWAVNIQGVLTYALTGKSIGGALYAQILNLISTYSDPSLWLLGGVTWGGAIIALVSLPYSWKRLSSNQRRRYSLLLVYGVLVLFSIIRGGMGFSHYLIQLAPFVAILSAQFLRPLVTHRLRRYAFVAVLAGITLSFDATVKGYRTLAKSVIQKQELPSGSTSKIARYLKDEGLAAEDEIYILNYRHIVYWLVDKQPPTRCVTHPSILMKRRLLPYCSGDGDAAQATPVSELLKILKLRPRYIIQSSNPPF